MKKIAKVIYEANVVKRLSRIGFQLLGDGHESIGEHTFLTSVIAYFLAKQHKKIDLLKVLTMSIFHDFHEARTGDITKLAKFYVKRNQQKANIDIFKETDKQLNNLLIEYEKNKTLEAQITYEANIIALLVQLKPLAEHGNMHAEEWINANAKRLRLPKAIDLAKVIVKTDSQIWWDEIRTTLHQKEYLK